MVIHSQSELETFQIAENLLANNNIFALSGPLGAGKTRFAKGLAQALGITDNIISPTYVLETEYKIFDSDKLFIHIDCYRMETFDELLRLGIEKRIKHKDVIVIEWADKFKFEIRNLKFENKIAWVKIEYGEKENERIITII